MALFEILDETGMRRLPFHQFAGQRLRLDWPDTCTGKVCWSWKSPARTVRTGAVKASPTSSDAEAAARAVLANEGVSEAKTSDNQAKMIRVLRVARSSAVKSRTQSINGERPFAILGPEHLFVELADAGFRDGVDERPSLGQPPLGHPSIEERFELVNRY